jgi:hypothetical protein
MGVENAALKDRRNEYEDTGLLRLHEVLPPRVEGYRAGGLGVWR